MQGLI
jgi:hypothetical protein